MSAAITRNYSLVGPEGCRGRARIGDMVHPAPRPCRVRALMLAAMEMHMVFAGSHE
jgi:hypothetical protein